MLPELLRYWTNVEVLGAPRMGKSTLKLEGIIGQVLANNTVFNFGAGKDDTHDTIVSFVASACPSYRSRIINASDPAHTHGYNPFVLPKGRNLSAHVATLASYVGNADSGTFGSRFKDEETAECFFAHLCVSHEPVWSALRLFDYAKRTEWARMDIPEEYKYQARSLANSKPDAWEYRTGALRRFLRPFATSEAIRKLLSVPEPVGIGDLYENRISLFVKASPSRDLSLPAGNALVQFMLADLFQVAVENAGRNRKTSVICDELQLYAPPTMADILDTCLSAGFHVTAIHHHSGQVQGDHLRQSLKTSCGVRVIFGGLPASLRKEIAEDHFSNELNERHHKQPKYMQFTDYEEEEYTTETTRDDGSVSTTTTSRLHPYPELEEIGYEDFSFEEVKSKLAARFNLPQYEYIILYPDRWEQRRTKQLRPYLPNSREVLEFIQNLPTPHEISFERSARAARKKSPARKGLYQGD